MHKILVPVDGSACSLRAVDYVISMAKEIGSLEVELVNVQEPPLVYGEIQIYMNKDEAERFRCAASERALTEATAKLTQGGVTFKQHALEGHIAATIVDYARESGCNSIVMGTRGMGALGNMVMGSVTTKVVHLAQMPVTLVK